MSLGRRRSLPFAKKAIQLYLLAAGVEQTRQAEFVSQQAMAALLSELRPQERENITNC